MKNKPTDTCKKMVIYLKNYEEALRAYEVLGCPDDFIIVPVSTFEQAVDYLEKLGDTNA